MGPGTPFVEKLRIVVILITLSLLWGSSFLAIKITVDAIQPILVFGVRFIFGWFDSISYSLYDISYALQFQK